MKSILLLSGLALSMLMQPAAKQNLCSTGCELVIDLIDGGSIEATEPLMITFGEGGFINDGSVTTGYARDEELPLSAGESIQFTAGGVLDLGDSGNIEYSAMNLIVNGNASITSLNEGTISIHGDSTFTVNGTFQINSDVNVSAELKVSAGGSTPKSNSLDLITGTGTITVAATGSITSNTASLEDLNTLIQTPTNIDNSTFITQENLTDLEGITMPTANDSSCIIQDAQCIDSEGNELILEEGQFVVEENNSGSMSLFNLLFLLSLFILYRGRYHN